MDEVCTERLLLRRFRTGDAEAYAAINADPLVVRYLGGALDRAASDAQLARIMAHWDEHGFGLWAAELLDDGRMVGFVGLSIPGFLPAVLPAVEVGWRWRVTSGARGLATEGGRAGIEWGFGGLGLDRIISIIDPDNVASVRVAEKLGMRAWPRRAAPGQRPAAARVRAERRRMTDLARRLAVARGDEPADVVITGGSVLSVFTREWLVADVAIADGWIAGVGPGYHGRETIDATGMWVVPGLIDAHVHIESSRLLPAEFAGLVLPHGTTTVVADPHEIANVLGTDGVHWLLDSTEGLPLDVFFMASSCVPASVFESPRRALTPGDLEGLLRRRRVLGLAEMMNFPGVIAGSAAELEKLGLAGAGHVDGHAPGVLGRGLQAYAAAGIRLGPRGDHARGGPRAAPGRDVGADPRGVGRPQPGRAPAAGGGVRARPARVLHRRPRPRPHRVGGPPELDGARRGRGGRRSQGCPRHGLPSRGGLARARRPRRRGPRVSRRPAAPARPARVPARTSC